MIAGEQGNELAYRGDKLSMQEFEKVLRKLIVEKAIQRALVESGERLESKVRGMGNDKV